MPSPLETALLKRLQEAKPSGVSIPAESGPAAFGTPEAAEALAPVWGMHPDAVRRQMMMENGQMTPAEKEMYDCIQRDQEAAQVKEWGGFVRPRVSEPERR